MYRIFLHCCKFLWLVWPFWPFWPFCSFLGRRSSQNLWCYWRHSWYGTWSMEQFELTYKLMISIQIHDVLDISTPNLDGYHEHILKNIQSLKKQWTFLPPIRHMKEISQSATYPWPPDRSHNGSTSWAALRVWDLDIVLAWAYGIPWQHMKHCTRE